MKIRYQWFEAIPGADQPTYAPTDVKQKLLCQLQAVNDEGEPEDIPSETYSPAVLVVNAPTHRHVKTQGEYTFIGFARMQSSHWRVVDAAEGIVAIRALSSVDMREVAVYRSIKDGSLWVRPREEFEDGRFEEVLS